MLRRRVSSRSRSARLIGIVVVMDGVVERRRGQLQEGKLGGCGVRDVAAAAAAASLRRVARGRVNGRREIASAATHQLDLNAIGGRCL